MATREYITSQEQAVIDHTNTLQSISESVLRECEIEGTDKVSPANRDCWGTLLVNLEVQRSKLDNAIAHLGRACGYKMY